MSHNTIDIVSPKAIRKNATISAMDHRSSKKRPNSKHASISSKKRNQSAMGRRTIDNSYEYGQPETKMLSHAKSESRIQSTINYKSGLIYDQASQKVPMYYSRPGPAQY